jgi:hypothetical protein
MASGVAVGMGLAVLGAMGSNGGVRRQSETRDNLARGPGGSGGLPVASAGPSVRGLGSGPGLDAGGDAAAGFSALELEFFRQGDELEGAFVTA